MNREELAAAYTAPAATITTSRISKTASRHSRAWKIFRRSIAKSCPRRSGGTMSVYDATRADNEELSARLAEQHVREDLRQEVGRLIRLTKTHDVQPDDRLGAILISIDLSILGAEPARYDAYAAAIRQEFIHVPEATIAPAAPKCSASSRPAGHLSRCGLCREI